MMDYACKEGEFAEIEVFIDPNQNPDGCLKTLPGVPSYYDASLVVMFDIVDVCQSTIPLSDCLVTLSRVSAISSGAKSSSPSIPSPFRSDLNY